ncbi:MAG: tetratricopeptide repeat protein [Escherichia coli]|nr:tetratricopeptide repeat protein [Escherichia coli]
METFNNENDQVDALKRFFAENGKALAVGVILGIGALVGWRYWTSHQQDTARDASLAYEKATSADAALKTLDAVKGEGWTAIVADLRGEILLSKGDKQGARAAWEAGVKSDASPALSEMMRMKMNNLSI